MFHDHDIHDAWNTSQAWVQQMRAEPRWHDRIGGGADVVLTESDGLSAGEGVGCLLTGDRDRDAQTGGEPGLRTVIDQSLTPQPQTRQPVGP